MAMAIGSESASNTGAKRRGDDWFVIRIIWSKYQPGRDVVDIDY
jgi:hypothetical protein